MRLIMFWLCAVLAPLFLAVVSPAAHAAMPPRPDGPVLDAAGIIPDAEEAALVERLSSYNRDTGRAIMVVIVPSLEGDTVANYALRLAQTWGVGGDQTDMGAVLLVAMAERKTRIEVGYGLEEYLPDILAARIVKDVVRPKFRAGDFAGGVGAGVDAIIAQLDRNPAETKAMAEAARAAERANRPNEDVSVGAVVFWVVLIMLLMLLFSRGRRRGYRRHSDAGVILWEVGNLAANIAINAAFNGQDSGGSGSDWGGFGGGDFGGGGASGDW